MGSPQKPTAQQVAELKQSGQLQTEGETRAIAIQDGRLNLPISLPRQATSLLLLNW